MYSGNLLLQPRSMFAPGAGKVVSSDYESVSVQLQKILTSEEGTLTLTSPSGAVAGQEFFVNVRFERILPNSLHQECSCDYDDIIRLQLPSPLPSNPSNWLAANLRIQPALASAISSSVANNVITYRMIRPGVRLEISSETASLVARNVTTQASNGMISNVGVGGGIFSLPANNTMRPGIKSLMGHAGFANANTIPMFMGVRRGYDKIQNECDPILQASWVKDDCCEVVRRGTIHVLLETLAPATLPAVPSLGIAVRFAPSGGNTVCGGFQILDTSVQNFAVPAGTILLPESRVELVASAPDRRTSLIRLI